VDREVRAAVLAFIGLALGVVWAAVVFRFVVPSILEARFGGSLLVGGAVGILGVIGLVALIYTFTRMVRRGLSGDRATSKERLHDQHLGQIAGPRPGGAEGGGDTPEA